MLQSARSPFAAAARALSRRVAARRPLAAHASAAASVADLPPLPYALDALQPHVGSQTLAIHHGKHHATYATNLKAALALPANAEKYGSLDLVGIVKASYEADKASGPIFNNAAQHWNHSFFWQCLKPGGGGAPPPALAAKLAASFGSVDEFKAKFKAAALGQFGSGWAWLVKDGAGLKIVATSNAVAPQCLGLAPVLTCDVWEHAYYLDYQNRRADFVEVFLEKLVNWEFAEKNLA